MLPRQHRLHLSADLRRVNRKGRRFVVSEAVFTVQKSNSLSKIGVITPRKIGNSVLRHRVARKVRAAAALFLVQHPSGFDIVVRAQPMAQELTVSQWVDLFTRSVDH